MASTFEVSICKGVFVTLCKLMMALSITAGSSSSGQTHVHVQNVRAVFRLRNALTAQIFQIAFAQSLL